MIAYLVVFALVLALFFVILPVVSDLANSGR